MNEGHAGFLGLERINSLITENGLTCPEALSAVRAGTVFTTHTPVPAGIDRFPVDLVRHYLDPGADGKSRLLSGLVVDEVIALGSEDDPSRFNMAHMGLRLAQRANGVAKLHGTVSRNMFAPLYPGFEPDEVPIGSVTNGVHLPTWAAREMYDVAGDMADWQDLASAEVWPAADKVSSDRLWELRNTLRERLVALARATVRKSHLQRGATVAELGWTDSILDPDILTIGFARRVSTYKRLTLMLRDPARLKAILLDPDRPVQIVIAGKAHPADDGGKRYMQEMVRFTDDPDHPAPHRLPARLRHGDGRRAVRGGGRLAEQPDPPAGGLRDVRHEGRAERRAEPVDLRRLVGRAVRRPRRLDHPDGRRRW